MSVVMPRGGGDSYMREQKWVPQEVRMESREGRGKEWVVLWIRVTLDLQQDFILLARCFLPFLVAFWISPGDWGGEGHPPEKTGLTCRAPFRCVHDSLPVMNDLWSFMSRHSLFSI